MADNDVWGRKLVTKGTSEERGTKSTEQPRNDYTDSVVFRRNTKYTHTSQGDDKKEAKRTKELNHRPKTMTQSKQTVETTLVR